eukprot:gene31833-65193_t
MEEQRAQAATELRRETDTLKLEIKSSKEIGELQQARIHELERKLREVRGEASLKEEEVARAADEMRALRERREGEGGAGRGSPPRSPSPPSRRLPGPFARSHRLSGGPRVPDAPLCRDAWDAAAAGDTAVRLGAGA